MTVEKQKYVQMRDGRRVPTLYEKVRHMSGNFAINDFKYALQMILASISIL